jgi:hypothetical protein
VVISGGRSQFNKPFKRRFLGLILAKLINNNLIARYAAPGHWAEFKPLCNQNWLTIIETINSPRRSNAVCVLPRLFIPRKSISLEKKVARPSCASICGS